MQLTTIAKTARAPRAAVQPTVGLASLLALGLVACGDLPLDPAEDNGPSAQAPLAALQLGAGSLTVSEFPKPPIRAFEHPLGAQEISLTQRNEVFMSYAVDESYGTLHNAIDTPSLIREDTRNDGAIVPGTESADGFDRRIRAAVKAQFDDDADLEIVAAGILGDGLSTEVYRADRNDQGEYVWQTLMSIPTTAFQQGIYGVTDLSIDAGDVDGDGYDEIALTTTSFNGNNQARVSKLYVFEDPLEGLHEMVTDVRDLTHVHMYPVFADLDGDYVDDLTVALRGDTTSNRRVALRRYQGYQGADSLQLSQNWTYVNLNTLTWQDRLVAGNFDDDVAEELAYVSTLRDPNSSTGFHRVKLNLTELNAAGQYERVPGSEAILGLIGYRGSSAEDNLPLGATATDRFGRGRDEVAFAVARNNEHQIVHADWDPNSETWSLDIDGTGYPYSTASGVGYFRASLTAADGDGDGAEELHIGLMGGTTAGLEHTHHVVYGWKDSGETGPFTWTPPQTFTARGRHRAPVLCAGDFDADGLTLQATGNTKVSVSEPIPLVVLTAAPTKEGITQNYDGTSTSYTYGTGSSSAIGVSSSVAWSASVGVEVSDLLDLFGASAKATVSSALTESETESASVSYSQGFAGSYSDDVVIFQGNLYVSYEYLVLSSPDDTSFEGEILSLDVPTSSRLYKWTVDAYNAVVSPEQQIGTDILPHQIGDPSSYRSVADVNGLLADHVGWRTPGTLPIGQGAGDNSMTIDLSTEMATEEEREMSLSAEVEFKVGGITAGSSISATDASLYSVSSSEFTAYNGTIGDIEDFDDYIDWDYGFGLAVYQPGRFAANLGEANEWAVGSRPFTVVTFWVDPQGTEY